MREGRPLREFRFDAIDGRLLGKEQELGPYPVICHMLDVAAVAGVVWDVLVPAAFARRLAARSGLSLQELRSTFMFWAGAHDLGKISPAHQKLVPQTLKALVECGDYPDPGVFEGNRLRHDKTVRSVLAPLLQALGYGSHQRRFTLSPADQIAQILGGHHGQFHEHTVRRDPGCGTGPWEVQREVHLVALRHFTGASTSLQVPLEAADMVVLCGLIVMADWLASPGTAYASRLAALPEAASDLPGRLTGPVLQFHWDDAVAAAPGLLARAGLGAVSFPDTSFAEAFPQIRQPYPLQATLDASLPGLVSRGGASLLIIAAPPGEGKTEAGSFSCAWMGAAAGANGIYFALPTMSTADAMYPRLCRFVAQNATGATSVTLAHSLDMISTALHPSEVAVGDSGLECAHTRPSPALQRGWWRLLSRFTVGTIDQVLAGVLPTRYNALRLSGLVGKVLVVDEAHAYGPWMHHLLQRLLEWCAAMGVPVVLMSATLSGATALPLVNAFRHGLGQELLEEVRVPYPGWLHSGSDGTVTDSGVLPTPRETRLSVTVAPVVHAPTSTGASTREALVGRFAYRVASEGGRLLVVCATVEAAQLTWDAVRELTTGTGAEIALLHSRVTSRQRAAVIAWAESRFGKDAPPEVKQGAHRQILIATSIVEQSLDWDFDHVLSDLAPLALLLQRAGRCQRHSGWRRPAWLEPGPAITVMDPVDHAGKFVPPRGWGKLYPSILLRRTRDALHDVQAAGIAVPGDVQGLIDRVYAAEFALRDERAVAADDLESWRAAVDAEEREWISEQLAESSLAQVVAVPAPSGARDLATLSGGAGLGGTGGGLVTDDLVTTRLGADSERVVCAYTQPDGRATLDSAGAVAVPGTGGKALTDNEVRDLVEHSIPVPGPWLRGREATAPGSWSRRAITKHLRLLRMSAEGDRWSNWEGKGTLRIDTLGSRGLWRTR